MVAKVEVMVEVEEAVEVEVMVEVEAPHMVSCLQPNFGFALRLWFLTFHVPELYFLFSNIITTNILICFEKHFLFRNLVGLGDCLCFRLGR